MKNSKRLDKRLFSSVVIAFIAVLFGVGIYMIHNTPEIVPDNSEKYKNQIDSLNKIINKSDSIISTLQLKVDSLEVKKITIINNYNEKVSVIRDASAAEHARWFESVIRNLEDYRGLE
jgi:hypothetical protein